MEQINVEDDVKTEFDTLQFDLKIKEGKKKTQSELVKMLMNFYKVNKGVIKK